MQARWFVVLVLLVAVCGVGAVDCGTRCACVDAIARSPFEVQVVELCGANPSVLLAWTEVGTGLQACLNTTNGWSLSFRPLPGGKKKQMQPPPPPPPPLSSGTSPPPTGAGWVLIQDGIVLAESESLDAATVSLFDDCRCAEKQSEVARACTSPSDQCALEEATKECCVALHEWHVFDTCNATIESSGINANADACAVVPSLDEFVTAQCAGCYSAEFEDDEFAVAECNGSRVLSARSGLRAVACSEGAGLKVCSGSAWEVVKLGEDEVRRNDMGEAMQWLDCNADMPHSSMCGDSVVVGQGVVGRDAYDLVVSNKSSLALPTQIALLTALTNLVVESTEMLSLPTQIGLVSSLQLVTLTNTSLLSVPSEIGQLSELQSLTLQTTLLVEIPSQLGNLAKLTSLSIERGLVAALPTELGRLGRLVLLNADLNRITTLPTELGLLSSARTIRLEKNHLTSDFAELSFLSQLGENATVSLTHNFLVGCAWGESWFREDTTVVVSNCMTFRTCAQSTLQRPEQECMVIDITSQPPASTNSTSITVQVEEGFPHYRRFALSANDGDASWLWKLTTPDGSKESFVTGVEVPTKTFNCSAEGSYTVEVVLVMFYKDIEVCRAKYAAIFDEEIDCSQADDICRIGGAVSLPCTVDDTTGLSLVVPWTVDTTPPTATITALLTSAIPSVVVGNGATVVPGSSAAFTILSPEDVTFDAGAVELSGCGAAGSFVVVDERRATVECFNVSSGVTAVLVLGDGALRDSAGNPSSPSSFSFTAICGTGQAIVVGASECEDVACPENTVGYPNCRCAKGFEGTVEWSTFEEQYVADCVECAEGHWSDGSIGTQCHCDGANAAACAKCSSCGFPRVVEHPCSRTTNTECSSIAVGLAPLYVSFGFAVVTTVFIHRTNALSPTHLARLVAYSSLGFVDLASDCYFIIFDAKGTLKMLSILFLVVPVLANLCYITAILRRALVVLQRRFVLRKPDDHQCAFRDALKESTKMYALVILASCFNPRLLAALLHDFLPQSQHWREPGVVGAYAPLIKSLQFAALLPSVLQDFPQLVIQSITVSNGTATFSAVLSLTCTVLSIVFEGVVVTLIVTAWSRDYSVHTNVQVTELAGTGSLSQGPAQPGDKEGQRMVDKEGQD